MLSGERPSFIQHSDHQTLWRGESLLSWNIYTLNLSVQSGCTPMKANANWTACLCFIIYELHCCKLTACMKAPESVIWLHSLQPHFFSSPLSSLICLQVFALICDVDNPQVFTVEFIRGQIRKYSSTERYTDITYTSLILLIYKMIHLHAA